MDDEMDWEIMARHDTKHTFSIIITKRASKQALADT